MVISTNKLITIFQVNMQSENMRVNWFDHVRKTRKKLSKGMKGKLVSHREAMKSASQSWPNLKAKLVKKIERQRKKQIKLAVETPLKPQKK